MSKKHREKALGFLKNRDLDGVVQWANSSRAALRILNAFTFESDDLIRWRAIEAIGKAVAGKTLPDARDLVRRQFWTMTEESGGTAWHAPEVIGEILANKPGLIKEFGIMLSSFFKEEPFERGVHWAVARTAHLDQATYQEITEALLLSLKEEDPFIRIHAVMILMALGRVGEADQGLIDRLKTDQNPITVYDFITGDLKETSSAKMLKVIKV